MRVNLHVTLTSFRNESRVLKETKSLIEHGIVDRATIIALHEPGLPERETLDPNRLVLRLALATRRWPRNLVVQLVKYVEFAARLLSHARAVRPTIVTVHSLALLPAGVITKWVTGAALVYDCHELETETFGLSGLRQTLSRLVERSLIRYADLVLVVSESIKEWYASAYGIDNLATVMNCPVSRGPGRTRKLHEALGLPEDRRIVLYQGGIVGGRGVDGLLRAFAAHDDGRHVLVFMGYGYLEPLVEEYASRHSNIRLQPAVPPDVVLEYTASADVGVSYIDNPSLNDRYCLPNKLFEYLMAGIPAIVNDAPEMRRLVETYGVGVVLQELSPHSIAGALHQLAERDQSDLQEKVAVAASRFSWASQVPVLVDAHKAYALKAPGIRSGPDA